MNRSFKKVIKVTLAAVILACALAACGKKEVPSGSYEAGSGFLGQTWNVTYTFKGSKVEASYEIKLLGTVSTETAEGTYEIAETDDGGLEITFDFKEETDYFDDGTYDYAEGDGYIMVGGLKCTKAEK